MINCIKGFTQVQKEGEIKVTLIHINQLFVVFRRLVSIECPGLNPDWLTESRSLR